MLRHYYLKQCCVYILLVDLNSIVINKNQSYTQMQDQLSRIKSSLNNIQNSLHRYQCDLPTKHPEQRILTSSIVQSQNQSHQFYSQPQSVYKTSNNFKKQYNKNDQFFINQRTENIEDLKQIMAADEFVIEGKEKNSSGKKSGYKPKSCKTEFVFGREEFLRSKMDVGKTSTVMQSIATEPKHIVTTSFKTADSYFDKKPTKLNKNTHKSSLFKQKKQKKPKSSKSSFTIQTTYIFNESSPKKKRKQCAYFIPNLHNNFLEGQMDNQTDFLLLTRNKKSKSIKKSQKKSSKSRSKNKFKTEGNYFQERDTVICSPNKETYDEYYCERVRIDNDIDKKAMKKISKNQKLSFEKLAFTSLQNLKSLKFDKSKEKQTKKQNKGQQIRKCRCTKIDTFKNTNEKLVQKQQSIPQPEPETEKQDTSSEFSDLQLKP